MSEIISHTYNNVTVQQRAGDGYINATAACKANGKLWADYKRQKAAQDFVVQLSRSMGIPIDVLIQTISTGSNEERGTWVHPRVAINLGQWLDAKFAVAVTEWVFERVSGNNRGYESLSAVAQARALLSTIEDLERAADAGAAEQRKRLVAEQQLKALTDDREALVNGKRAAERARDELLASLRGVAKHAGKELHKYDESRADDQLDLMARRDAENVHTPRIAYDSNKKKPGA